MVVVTRIRGTDAERATTTRNNNDKEEEEEDRRRTKCALLLVFSAAMLALAACCGAAAAVSWQPFLRTGHFPSLGPMVSTGRCRAWPESDDVYPPLYACAVELRLPAGGMGNVDPPHECWWPCSLRSTQPDILCAKANGSEVYPPAGTTVPDVWHDARGVCPRHGLSGRWVAGWFFAVATLCILVAACVGFGMACHVLQFPNVA